MPTVANDRIQHFSPATKHLLQYASSAILIHDCRMNSSSKTSSHFAYLTHWRRLRLNWSPHIFAPCIFAAAYSKGAETSDCHRENLSAHLEDHKSGRSMVLVSNVARAWAWRRDGFPSCNNHVTWFLGDLFVEVWGGDITFPNFQIEFNYWGTYSVSPSRFESL